MTGAVTDNPARNRFELTMDGATAFAAYRIENGQLVFTHTEVPDSLSGHGVGSTLARGALDAARARGMPVVARCRFIADFIQKHPEYQDLLAGS
ncbi:GNAT family N-acetyltransferase [Azospirillum sp. sgz301742]